MTSTVTQDAVNDLASRGITDFSKIVGNIVDNYANCVALTNTIQGYAINAGIKFHPTIQEFYNTDLSYSDPADSSFLTNLLNALTNFIHDCPGITGISFNDFVYPLAYYHTGQLTTQRATMVNIATNSYSTINSANPNLIFSIAMYEGNAALYSQIAPHCDYLLPESTHRDGNTDSNFVINAVEYIKSQVGNNKFIPALSTYSDDANRVTSEWDDNFLLSDIQNVLLVNPDGYSLWAWPYLTSTLKFTPIITCNPPGNEYANLVSVELSTDTPGTIYYTLDGSIPDESSPIYTNNILISEYQYSTILKYFAMDGEGNISNIYSQLYVINMESSSQIDYGLEIRNRLSEHSNLQIENNPGRIMIDESIGKEFSSIEVDIFSNARARLLQYATGKQLDYYGDWFGIPRNGMDDDTYRANIIAFRMADTTIAGLKQAINAILNITVDEIIITNQYPNYCRAGADVRGNLQTGTPCTFAGHFLLKNKRMTIMVPITVPFLSIQLLESVIDNLVIPGVYVTIVGGIQIDYGSDDIDPENPLIDYGPDDIDLGGDADPISSQPI
jgi:hypothetical protein